jgi:hypothetical protein
VTRRAAARPAARTVRHPARHGTPASAHGAPCGALQYADGAHGASCGAPPYAGWRAWCVMRRAAVRRMARTVRHAARCRTPDGAHGASCGALPCAVRRAAFVTRRMEVRHPARMVRRAVRCCAQAAYAGTSPEGTRMVAGGRARSARPQETSWARCSRLRQERRISWCSNGDLGVGCELCYNSGLFWTCDMRVQ